MTKKVLLYFPQCETEKPIISHLVRDYNLMVNLFRAKVTPNEEGYLILDLIGGEEHISQAMEYIRELNIEIRESSSSILWSQERCVSCGNCLTHCPTKALGISDRTTMQIHFDHRKCVDCQNCIEVCPFNAITALF